MFTERAAISTDTLLELLSFQIPKITYPGSNPTSSVERSIPYTMA